MHPYRRNRVPGGTFFFTVRLREQGSSTLTDHVAAFGDAMRNTRAKYPFHIDAWVVLPDHAHTIWTLPPGDYDSATRWRMVKIAFSKALKKAGCLFTAPLWAQRFDSHPVGDDDDYEAAVDYLHENPVRHGLCARPEDWQWSSVHRFIADGMVPVLALVNNQHRQGIAA